jgi:hypothetical protein
MDLKWALVFLAAEHKTQEMGKEGEGGGGKGAQAEGSWIVWG